MDFNESRYRQTDDRSIRESSMGDLPTYYPTTEGQTQSRGMECAPRVRNGNTKREEKWVGREETHTHTHEKRE